MTRQAQLVPFFLLLSASLAGCLDSSGSSDAPRATEGEFEYCRVTANDACGTTGFMIRLTEGGAEILDPNGATRGAVNHVAGVMSMEVSSDQAAGPRSFLETLGPGLYESSVEAKLVLATSLLSQWRTAPLQRPTELGTLTIERIGDETTLDIELGPGGGVHRHLVTFAHPDGRWPPQTIDYERFDENDKPENQSYRRVGNAAGATPYALTLPPWQVGSTAAQRIPQFLPDFGFSRDLNAVLSDAQLHPDVGSFMQTHPDWTVQFARVTRASDGERFQLELAEECAGLTLRMSYLAALVPQFVEVADKQECREGQVKLDQLSQYRLADPLTLLDLAARHGFQDATPSILEYEAPDATLPGPQTLDGSLTSLGGHWRVGFVDVIMHEGTPYNWLRTFQMSLPDEQAAFHALSP